MVEGFMVGWWGGEKMRAEAAFYRFPRGDRTVRKGR
jgi:hypothetical protein